jgi:hypothetical protein
MANMDRDLNRYLLSESDWGKVEKIHKLLEVSLHLFLAAIYNNK